METGAPPGHLCFETGSYAASVCLLTAENDSRPPGRIHSVATPYPNLARQLLSGTAPDADIIAVSGSTEALVPDIADACFDLVETGTSAMLNSLAVRRCFLDVTTHLARSEGCDPAVEAPVVGLRPGNVYLAGAEALWLALDFMGDTPLFRGPERVLRELAALELVYLFPVAGKFRSGAYDGQIQYRLNGWGRGLAARLTAAPAGAAQAGTYRQECSAHLARERERYDSFLSQLDVARQDYGGNRLDAALALPIPVLV